MTTTEELTLSVVGTDGATLDVLTLHGDKSTPVTLALKEALKAKIKGAKDDVELVVDFGLLLDGSRLLELGRAGVPGYRTKRAAGGVLELEHKKEETGDLTMTIPAVKLTSRPYGTILFRLAEGGRSIAMTEIDVAPPAGAAALGEPLPVSVQPSPGQTGAPEPHKKHDLVLEITNKRTKGGAGAPLSDSDWTSGITPRIRITLPAPPAPPFATALELKEMEVRLHGDVGYWSVREAESPWIRELLPGARNKSLLPPGGVLKVTLKSLRPSVAGSWKIAVSFLDFPGYGERTISVDSGTARAAPQPRSA